MALYRMAGLSAKDRFFKDLGPVSNETMKQLNDWLKNLVFNLFIWFFVFSFFYLVFNLFQSFQYLNIVKQNF